uniref:Uncharacterized protein n=1 Tax=Parascaris equorum TaxID=6256 RepID=A0A914RZV7_PAREQ
MNSLSLQYSQRISATNHAISSNLPVQNMNAVLLLQSTSTDYRY